MERIGTLQRITRFPVKSMGGEALQSAMCTVAGLLGDREFAFASSNSPRGMHRVTSQQRRAMLLYHARRNSEGVVRILCPSGEELDVTSQELLHALEEAHGMGGTFRLIQAAEPQTEVRPLSLHAEGDLGNLERGYGATVHAARMRSNLVLQMERNQTLPTLTPGALLAIGPDAVLELLEEIPRCRFITYDPEAPFVNEPAFPLMRFLERSANGRFGVYARVHTPGEIRAGDAVSLRTSLHRMMYDCHCTPSLRRLQH